jgi:hypothetical protein
MDRTIAHDLKHMYLISSIRGDDDLHPPVL